MKKRLNGKKKPAQLLNPANGPFWVKEIISGVPEGMRHDSAIRLVGRWYGLGLYTAEVIYALITWNKLNLPPLGRQEMNSIIQSTIKWACPR